jgi:hypothetical protein
MASKPHSIVARPAPRKLVLEGQAPTGYLQDAFLRVSDLVATHRKGVAVFTIEGVAGVGKTALGEIIIRFGLPGYRRDQIAVMETDHYLPALLVSSDGKKYLQCRDGEQFSSEARNYMKAIDWKGFVNDFKRQNAGRRAVFLVGLYAMYFYSKLERPEPPVARILVQGPNELALTQAMRRDGTDAKHAVSLNAWQKIKEDFPQQHFSVTVDAGRPWLDNRRQPLKANYR